MKWCLLVITWCYCCSVFADQLSIEEEQFIDKYNKDHDKPIIKKDEAWLTVVSTVGFDVHVYIHNHECWKCDRIYLQTIDGNDVATIILNTTYGTDIEFRRNIIGQDEEISLCNISRKFKENGDYWMFYNQSDFGIRSCDLNLVNDPMTAEMPILYVAAGILVLWIIVKAVAYCYSVRVISESYDVKHDEEGKTNTNNVQMAPVPVQVETTEVPMTTHHKRSRLHSLDTFRGFSLLLMIFVNYGGGGYWFFDHPPWNGLTVADLVFPWFVFIMGTSMNYSFKSMLKRGKSRGWIFCKVFKRTCLLFTFGIILNTNWGPVDLNHLRIPGVLQRLSLSYFVVALLETIFAKNKVIGQKKSWHWIRDIVSLLPQWIINLIMLGTYLALTFALPVPGCPRGYIGPGGLHEYRKYENCTGGAAGYIDRVVLGENHIYGNPTPKAIYQTKVPYDPEGILGTLTSIFLCFLGLQGGRIFLYYDDHYGRLIRLLVWSLITGAVGIALCNASKNDGIIPLNKNLWSVSFILITACFGYFLLAILYILVDVLKWWRGTPFIFAGMNPLVIYLCHDIFYRFFPINWQIEAIHWKLLIKAVWDVIIWLILAFVLYCKKIFIAL
ncbi:hypothetical protein ACF0H5_018060 [Mactra antiquata]